MGELPGANGSPVKSLGGSSPRGQPGLLSLGSLIRNAKSVRRAASSWRDQADPSYSRRGGCH